MVAVTDALKRASVDKSCLVSKCSEAGCNVSLKGMPNPHVVMSLEHSAAPIDRIDWSRPHCDYLVAYQETNPLGDCLVALELKSTVRASEVVDQLRGGAAIAEKLLTQTPAVKFTPVVAGKAHTYAYTELRKSRIQFQGRWEQIRLTRCGDPLTKALGRR